MNASAFRAEKHFFEELGLDRSRVEATVSDSLGSLDDGELFLEYALTECLTYDDGALKTASFDSSHGFGLRGVAGELTAYAHSNDLSESAIRRAAKTVEAARKGHGGSVGAPPMRTNQQYYEPDNPFSDFDFAEKISLLQKIDDYARKKDDRVIQVSATLLGRWQVVHIMRADGQTIGDIRPLVRLSIGVVMKDGDRRETGSDGAGGRYAFSSFFEENHWRDMVDEAIRQGSVNLESVAAPAGEMPVVLGPGWPGILLHEAVGHGLEGDFNRKKSSAFAGLMGQPVAARGVTVVDDGTLLNRRGSLTVDDEGTPTERTVLIEDGILKNLMQDRLNARLMKMRPTGNGRRESYDYAPMPRMTNTFMLAGESDPAEIISAVKDGLYAVHFGGGQVDITNGKFVFSCTEAYRIRDGRVAEPVKGATLIGNGPDVLQKVVMIGNDLQLDKGIGTCGKAGQSIPAGVGQPTLLIDRLTVGGTAA